MVAVRDRIRNGSKSELDRFQSTPTEQRSIRGDCGCIVPVALHGPAFAAAEGPLRSWRAQNGERAIQIALNAGQHMHSNGLYYGGLKPTWARRTMGRIIQGNRLHDRCLVGVIVGICQYKPPRLRRLLCQLSHILVKHVG